MRPSRLEGDGKRREAPEEDVLPPLHRAGEIDVGEPLDQRGHSDLCLVHRQARPEAEMNPATERQRPDVGASHITAVGVHEPGWVAVSRPE